MINRRNTRYTRTTISAGDRSKERSWITTVAKSRYDYYRRRPVRIAKRQAGFKRIIIFWSERTPSGPVDESSDEKPNDRKRPPQNDYSREQRTNTILTYQLFP